MKKNNSKSFEELNEKITKKIIVSLLLNAVIIFLSLIFHKRIIKLFNNIPFYFFLLIVFLLIFIFYLFYRKRFIKYLEEKKNPEKETVVQIVYKVIDYLTFALNIISSVYLVMFFALTPANVVGGSMEKTFYNGDKVLIYHLTKKYKTNDVVVIDSSRATEEIAEMHYKNTEPHYIKRITGLPKDTMEFAQGQYGYEVYINNMKMESVYLSEKMYNTLKNSLINGKIPEGCYFVLGDNRLNSIDSEELGFFKKEEIMGKVKLRFLPINKMKIFTRYS